MGCNIMDKVIVRHIWDPGSDFGGGKVLASLDFPARYADATGCSRCIGWVHVDKPLRDSFNGDVYIEYRDGGESASVPLTIRRDDVADLLSGKGMSVSDLHGFSFDTVPPLSQ